ncbi:hypothetical protein [Pseudonocardia thermophila]|uniref:hypothetical protein n=1 Tax=Pseudonocardia thermophila TaxID=1848 RepID=UPI00116148FD|nr:hypothetical protein [Pseudonocardia thermophila]
MPTLRAALAGVVGVLLIVGVAFAVVGPTTAGTPVAAPAQPDPAAATATLPPERPSTSAPAAPEDRMALLRAALLRPSEVGPGWRVAPEQPLPNPSVPAVCGGHSVIARFPDAQRVGVALLGSRSGERVQETLSVFGDRTTARAAYDAYAEGLDCTKGSLSGTPVTISEPEDVRDRVQGDRATAWTLTGSGFRALLVSVLTGDQLVNFVFLTPDGSSLTRVDALVLARTGVARLQAT